jgi:hypothetical protein
MPARCAKASSDSAQPPAGGTGSPPAYQPRPGIAARSRRQSTTFGSLQARCAASAGGTVVSRSPGPPRSSATTSVRSHPARPAPSSAGPAPGAVSTAVAARARQTLSAGRSARPCALTTATSSHGRPRRANALATLEAAGSTVGAQPRSRSNRTMPKNPGSPLASTTARRPATRASTGSTGPISIVSAAGPTEVTAATAARWRGAPATTSAAARAARAAGGSGPPSMPSTVNVTAAPRWRSSPPCGSNERHFRSIG